MRTYEQRRKSKALAIAKGKRRARNKKQQFKMKLTLQAEYLTTTRLMRSYIRYAKSTKSLGWLALRKVKREYQDFRKKAQQSIKTALYQEARVSTTITR